MQIPIHTPALDEASLNWLMQAAVNRIQEGSTCEAQTGATALHQLLRGTAAEPDAHRLLAHLTQAQHATHAIPKALQSTPTEFP